MAQQHITVTAAIAPAGPWVRRRLVVSWTEGGTAYRFVVRPTEGGIVQLRPASGLPPTLGEIAAVVTALRTGGYTAAADAVARRHSS